MKKTILLIVTTLVCVATAAQQPATKIWDGAQLRRVKLAVARGDVYYKSTYDKLLREADKALAVENPSVVTKGKTPGSGDKHDYMSMGRYWWPDPDKPDGLPYIRKDGYSNPELKDYDRDKLDVLCTGVTKLALAWYLSDKGDYARKAVSMLSTWFLDPKTRMNPSMNYGQVVPGRYDGKGRGEGLLDTYGFVDLVDAITVLETSGYLSKKERQGLRDWFAQYVAWMTSAPTAREEEDAKNNHAVAFDVQLTAFAAFAGQDSIARRVIAQFPARRIYPQIEPDGRQPLELARTTGFGYSLFNLGHFLDMAFVAQKYGVNLLEARSDDGRSIPAAIDYLVQFLGKPQSAFPYQQLRDWDKLQGSLAENLLRAYQLTGNQEYKALFDKYRPQTPTTTFVLLNL